MVFKNYSSSCPLYPDHPSRCNTILAVKRTFASFSLIGCVFVIALIWLFQKYRFFVQRMILALSIAALLDSVSYLMGDIYTEGSLCDAQAFLMSYFDWASLMWVCCITFNLLLAIITRTSKTEYEKWYHVVSWGIPFIWAVVPFIGDHYGPAGVWCWIDDKSVAWRFGVWYVPLFLLIVLMLLTYSYIVCTVYRQAGEWGGSFRPEDEADKDLLKREVKQLMAYPFIYLILSICPLIYRIHNASNPNKLTSYPLIIMTVIFGPLQGACNAVAFAFDRDTLNRLSFNEIRTALKARSSSSARIIHDYRVEDAPNETPSHSPSSPQSPRSLQYQSGDTTPSVAHINTEPPYA